MKVQCPGCENTQEIPTEYEHQNIKCLACKQPFEAVKFVPPPEIPAHAHEEQKTVPAAEPPQVKCPQCSSTQISSDKKGFSGGKAVGGALVLGPIGLLAGLHKSKKVVITCLNCGHQWRPGGVLKSF